MSEENKEENKKETEENTDAQKEENKEERGEVSESSEEFNEAFEKKKKPYAFAAIVVIAFLAGYFISPTITGFMIGPSDGSLSENDISNKMIAFINENVVPDGGVTLISSEKSGDLYRILVSYQGNQMPIHTTKDGRFLVLGNVIDTLSPQTPVDNGGDPQPVDTGITKLDKPTVELFVMTHCPYGTQSEKGIIPTLKTLGDSVDAKIRFVHYFMHGDKEEQETYRQVCIREDQPEKFLAYLECFLEDDDSSRCLSETGIDTEVLSTCMENSAADYYAQDSAISEGYGVRGSPTLVVNGQIANSARSSAAYLATICSAFNVVPENCAAKLSSEAPSPGFGYSGTGASGGSCG
ncbi:MAG: thioredoxin domain-containing protein [Candidatus Aenigmarchaeota archaeon]|nr:thioredoxin domain-containing protein [Candidatus Aenigmarchaeota archaeon]